MKLFWQKKCNIFERWGLHPQTPVPPAAGGFAPYPQTPKTAPHCEFLATRLGVANLLNKKGRILINKLPKVLDTNSV